jgi:hypothetical protein
MAQDPWVAIREQPYGVRAAERDSLVRTLLLYAVKRIANGETFAPFGAVASADGTLRLVDPGGDARQPPSEVLPYLEQTLLKDEVANGARAVASVADATAGGKVVTICIHVEHADGYAMDVIRPYAKKRWFRAGSFRQPSRIASERRICLNREDDSASTAR